MLSKIDSNNSHMQFSAEEFHVYELLSDTLSQMKGDYILNLSSNDIVQICEKIVIFFRDIHRATQTNPDLSLCKYNRIVWTENYQQAVNQFTGQLVEISQKLGGIGPLNDDNTLFVADEGHIAANRFGHPTLKAVTSRLIGSVFDELAAVYYPNHATDIKDKAVLCLYWAILSSIYASNIKTGNIRLYTVEPKVHSTSFFWNFELPIIRTNCPQAQIHIYQLTPSAKTMLQNLKDSGEIVHLFLDHGPIYDLLTNEHNWILSDFETQLTLSSGFNEGKNAVRYSTLSEIFSIWKNHKANKNAPAISSDDLKINQPG